MDICPECIGHFGVAYPYSYHAQWISTAWTRFRDIVERRVRGEFMLRPIAALRVLSPSADVSLANATFYLGHPVSIFLCVYIVDGAVC